MPQPLLWASLESKGDMPGPRSGHSLTKCGDHYVILGGMKQNDKGEVGPTDEIYELRISPNACNWQRKTMTNADPAPLPRSQHVAVYMKDN